MTALRCWSCGKDNDALTAVIGEGQPDDGDLAMCFECGEWAAFLDGIQHKPTDEQFEDIGNSEECRHVRLAWLAMDKERRKSNDGKDL